MFLSLRSPRLETFLHLVPLFFQQFLADLNERIHLELNCSPCVSPVRSGISFISASIALSCSPAAFS